MKRVPVKKRKARPQSPPPPPPSSPPQPQAPAQNNRKLRLSRARNPPLQIGESSRASESSSQPSHSKQKAKSAKGAAKAKPVAKASESTDADFYGLELLADTVLSAVDGDHNNVNDAFVVEENAATRGEASSSAAKDNSGALVDNLQNDKNGRVSGTSPPRKRSRLHWDLNVSIDEWEKPLQDMFERQKPNSGIVLRDAMKSGKVTSEAFDVGRCLEKQKWKLSSSPNRNAKRCVDTPTADMAKALKSLEAETKAPIPVSSRLVQKEKVISRTSITREGNLSQNVQVEKVDVVSTDRKPVQDKPLLFGDRMRNDNGEDFSKISGKDHTSSDKLSSKDPVSECNSLEFSQDNRGRRHIAVLETIKEVEEGYDSPFEEGELREPGLHPLEYVEEEGAETAEKDSGSVDRDNVNVHDKNFAKNEAGRRTGYDVGSDNAAPRYGLRSRMRSSSCSLDERAYGRNQSHNHVNAQGNWRERDNGAQTGEFRGWQPRQNFSSRTHRPNNDPTYWRRPASPQQQRVQRDYDRSPRQRSPRRRSPRRASTPFPGMVSYPANHQNSRAYHGQEAQDYSAPSFLVPAVFVPFDYNYNSRFPTNRSTNGTYQPYHRRNSPPRRNSNNSWNHGRSDIHGNGHRRQGQREEFPYNNSRAPPFREHQYLGRRERAGTPHINSGGHFSRPHENTRSRSRSRTPFPFARRESRSPVRPFRRSQSVVCDSVDYSGRWNSDENSRSFRSRETSPHMAGTDRRHNLGKSIDDRNANNSGAWSSLEERRASKGRIDASAYPSGTRGSHWERGAKYHNRRNDAAASSSVEQELKEEDTPRDQAGIAKEENGSFDLNGDMIDSSSAVTGHQVLEKGAAPMEKEEDAATGDAVMEGK